MKEVQNKDIDKEKENEKVKNINIVKDKNKSKKKFIIISSIVSVLLVIIMHIFIRDLIDSSLNIIKTGSNYLKESGVNINSLNGKTFEDIKILLNTKVYWVRAALKLLIFLFPILIYFIINNKKFKSMSFKNKIDKNAFILGGVVLLGTLFGFFLIKDFLDMTKITKKIQAVSSSKLNYIFMYVYIFTINAFLEELFFRGYLFIELKKYIKPHIANIISSALFGIYHIGIVGELSFKLAVLSVIGLFIVGYIFNLFNLKKENIYTSYILHASANIAINTIGLFYAFL